MDGINGAATFVDEKGHVVSSINTVTDTTIPKFGTACALFSGGSACLYTPDSADFQFGTSDFTIEFWFYPSDVTTIQEIFTKGPGIQIYMASGYLMLALSDSNSANYFVNQAGVATNLALTPNKWSHVALVKDSTGYILCLDGVATSFGIPTTYVNTGTSDIVLGAYNYTMYPFYGYMDDVRITKGVARYSSNGFAVPIAAFPNS